MDTNHPAPTGRFSEWCESIEDHGIDLERLPDAVTVHDLHDLYEGGTTPDEFVQMLAPNHPARQ